MPGILDPTDAFEAAPVPVDEDLLAKVAALRKDAIQQLRQAAARPEAQFSRVTGRFEENPIGIVREVEAISQQIANQAKAAGREGRFDAAWDDVRTLFRVAGHLNQTTPDTFQAIIGNHVHALAVQAALDWALAPGLPAARLREALRELGTLPGPPSALRVIETESANLELLLGLPRDQFNAEILKTDLFGQRGGRANLKNSLSLMVIGLSWERTRARRGQRLVDASLIRQATLEPYLRTDTEQLPAVWGPISPVTVDFGSGLEVISARTIGDAWLSTPLLRFIGLTGHSIIHPCDAELMKRRMLETAMALQLWRLEHEGALPDSLDRLVPAILPELPIDPYSGRPFRLDVVDGRLTGVPAVGVFSDRPGYRSRTSVPEPGPDQPVLIGVDEDRVDDGGLMSFGMSSSGDYLLSLPRQVDPEARPEKP